MVEHRPPYAAPVMGGRRSHHVDLGGVRAVVHDGGDADVVASIEAITDGCSSATST